LQLFEFRALAWQAKALIANNDARSAALPCKHNHVLMAHMHHDDYTTYNSGQNHGQVQHSHAHQSTQVLGAQVHGRRNHGGEAQIDIRGARLHGANHVHRGRRTGGPPRGKVYASCRGSGVGLLPFTVYGRLGGAYIHGARILPSIRPSQDRVWHGVAHKQVQFAYRGRHVSSRVHLRAKGDQ